MRYWKVEILTGRRMLTKYAFSVRDAYLTYKPYVNTVKWEATLYEIVKPSLLSRNKVVTQLEHWDADI